MASVDWQKYKGGTDAKAHLHHDAQDSRQETKEHKNKQIDPERTKLNFSVNGLTYAQRCQKYDDAIQAYSQKRIIRKDAVTLLGLYAPVPEGIATDDKKCREWIQDYHAILCDFFGADNIIDTDGHFDEIHDYYDPIKKQHVTSRVHAHSKILPFTSDGRLCAKELFTRGNLNKLNNAVEQMTMDKYGCVYMTGETPQHKSVEELKLESVRADTERQMEDIKAIPQKAPKKPVGRRISDFVKGVKDDTVEVKKDDLEALQATTANAIRLLQTNATVSDEEREKIEQERKKIEQEREELERLRSEQEDIIQTKAKEIAEQKITDAVKAAKKQVRDKLMPYKRFVEADEDRRYDYLAYTSSSTLESGDSVKRQQSRNDRQAGD